MNRRDFFSLAAKAAAAGLVVPEYLLDPPWGRSMVSVPVLSRRVIAWVDRTFTMANEVPPGEYSFDELHRAIETSMVAPHSALKIERGMTIEASSLVKEWAYSVDKKFAADGEAWQITLVS